MGMQLIINGKDAITDPSAEDLAKALMRLETEHSLALEDTARRRGEDSWYLQTLREEESLWLLEYQAGSLERDHYEVPSGVGQIETLIRVFKAYLAGDERGWRDLFDWVRQEF